MPLILGTNSIKDTGYDVANSLRFDRATSNNLTETPGSAGNKQTWTWSGWIKRASNLTVEQNIMHVYDGSASNRASLKFQSNGTIGFDTGGSGSVGRIDTSAVYRDVSAWYHVVFVMDTTNGTGTDRQRIYVNGVRQTTTVDAQVGANFNDGMINTTNAHEIGVAAGGGYFDGYMSEVVFLDGTAASDATSFGEFDGDSPTIWKPKDVSGLTFGTNGFYLEFKESGTSQNSSGLGADTSGQDNHFAVNNLTSVDQTTDTCTNNYNTMNPLENYYGGQTYSEGNLKSVSPSGNAAAPIGTIGVSNGRWYAESKLTAQGANQTLIGISSNYATQDDFNLGRGATSYGLYSATGKYYVNNGSAQTYGTSYTTNDIIGVYIDLTSNKLYFSKNGTVMNSGTGISITAAASTEIGAYFFSAMQWDNATSATWEWNFGAGTTYAISSGNTDDNGYGNFEYSPNITGDGAAKKFYALNTKNLAEFG
jgi:hypothetical protein